MAIIENFEQLKPFLEEGAIVTFNRERIRVRSLPILG